MQKKDKASSPGTPMSRELSTKASGSPGNDINRSLRTLGTIIRPGEGSQQPSVVSKFAPKIELENLIARAMFSPNRGNTHFPRTTKPLVTQVAHTGATHSETIGRARITSDIGSGDNSWGYYLFLGIFFLILLILIIGLIVLRSRG